MSVKDIVTEMLEESDNDTAELLVKELGHRFGGEGTTTAGLGVAPRHAGRRRPADGRVDGGRRLRARPGRPGHVPPARRHVDDRPPRAPRSWTPCRWRRATARWPTASSATPPPDGCAGKTGSLDGVISLSGVVDSSVRAGSRFALVMNQLPSEAVGLQFADAVGDILALYPDVPKPDEIAP